MVKPRALLLVTAVVGVSACGGSPAAPLSRSVPPPIPLSIASVQPNTGLSTGGSYVTINGTGFRSATLTIGGARADYNLVGDYEMYAVMPAHAPGLADVTVTNNDGQSASSPGALTYLATEDFDFNGLWEGGAVPDSWSVPFQLTVEHDRVISFSCGSAGVIVLDPAPPLHDGRFAYVGAKGVSIDGVIRAPTEVDGAINAPSCEQTYWYARKK